MIYKKKTNNDYMVFFTSMCLLIAPNTLVGYFCFTLFIFFALITNVKKFKKLPLYFCADLFFLLYMVYQIVFLDLYSKAVSVVGLRNIFITYVFGISMYLCIRKIGFTRVIVSFGNGIIVGNIIILFLYFNSIFSGGLSAVSYIGLGPLQIGGVAAVSIAWIDALTLCFLWPLYLQSRDKNNLYKCIILLIFSILTGRRKILILIAISIFGGYYFVSKTKGIKKVCKTLFFSTIGLLIVYLMFTKIPILYNFVGERFVKTINYVLNGEISSDASLLVRSRLTETAIYAWKANPIFGQGYNSFSLLYTSGGHYSHSNYLELLVSFGIIGTVIYYSKYIYIAAKLLKKYLKNKRDGWVYVYLMIVLITIMFLENYQITYMYRSLSVFLIFFIGLLYNTGEVRE